MREKIVDIISKICDVDKKELENVDLIEEEILDSLAFINLISKLEDEFDIEIQPTQIPHEVWSNVDLIVQMVEEKINQKI